MTDTVIRMSNDFRKESAHLEGPEYMMSSCCPHQEVIENLISC